MKIKLIFMQLGLAFCALQLSAASMPCVYFSDCESKFSNYSSYCQEALNLKMLLPDGFVDQARAGHYAPKAKLGNLGKAVSFDAMAKSADGECLLLLPDEKMNAYQHGSNKEFSCEKMILSDVYWSVKEVSPYYLYFFDNPPMVDLRKYVREISAVQQKADKAYLVTLPVNDTIEGVNYVGKVVLYAEKKGRMPISDVTMLFTAAGWKNKQKYVDAVLKCVGFGDKKDWTYDKGLEQKLAGKYFAPYNEMVKRQNAESKVKKE